MPEDRATDPSQVTDLAIVGAGVAACSLVAALRQQGWDGSIVLLESGRGVGGRAATRRSRHNPGLAINHGAPLFNLTTEAASSPLLAALVKGGWIEPFSGAIHSLTGSGRIGPPIDDGFSGGQLWQAGGGMERLAAGLLALAAAQPGNTPMRSNSRMRSNTLVRQNTLVRRLTPSRPGNTGTRAWSLEDGNGAELLQCHWLVLSGSLLAHPRGPQTFGWDGVPLQQAAAQLGDRRLDQAAAALAAMDWTASSNLLLNLPTGLTATWQQQPWRLLQFTPEAQQRWGLRRVSLQPQPDHRWAVVAESSTDVADRHRQVYGSRSSAAQLLAAAPDASAEAAVIDALDQALQQALDLPTRGADRQLMRWGAAFPRPPGLPTELQLCPDSRIGFCGDVVAGEGLGRVEGAI
ncbi:MAG: NAD(P)-binding protein, partial [Cyanobacteriota bacterium]|nr:NAD(P)-binding protein [Cyanobacteriota bacterium]